MSPAASPTDSPGADSARPPIAGCEGSALGLFPLGPVAAHGPSDSSRPRHQTGNPEYRTLARQLRRSKANLALARHQLKRIGRTFAMMHAGYPGLRAAINALYDVAAARYADPALRFRAADTGHADWAP